MGIKLMNKIESAILKLEQEPYRCMEVQIKPHNDNYRKLLVENYVVLYDIDENYKQVIVYRIVYQGMDYLS